MRFLCDQMLVRIGKWLRAAGYDTEIIINSETDQEILLRAIKEQRTFITRDRHFLSMNTNHHIIWLSSNSLEQCIKELTEKLSINWTLRPFSRCTVCNTVLIKAPEEKLAQVPEKVLNSRDAFWYCKTCQKVYWEGTHTEEMRKQFEDWNLK